MTIVIQKVSYSFSNYFTTFRKENFSFCAENIPGCQIIIVLHNKIYHLYTRFFTQKIIRF